jgi:hypothetical protein
MDHVSRRIRLFFQRQGGVRIVENGFPTSSRRNWGACTIYFPLSIFKTLVSTSNSEINWMAMRIGPGKHLKGRKLLHGTVPPEEFDYFHDLILGQEGARHGQRGFIDGLLSGMIIGLPTVLNFGSQECKKHVVEDVLSGRKFLSLAISEAFAGSDVAGLRCKAVLSDDKKHWIVTGTKKWITNGQYSDFFAVSIC